MPGFTETAEFSYPLLYSICCSKVFRWNNTEKTQHHTYMYLEKGKNILTDFQIIVDGLFWYYTKTWQVKIFLKISCNVDLRTQH